MRRKRMIITLFLLMFGAALITMVRTDMLYTNHAAAVDDTIEDLLANRDLLLPRQQADLSMASSDSPAVASARVVEWQTEFARLENTRSILFILLDDDPIYRLRANIRVVYEDGEESIVSWESWRYGLVLGPWVFSMGDGPPGFITSVASADNSP